MIITYEMKYFLLYFILIQLVSSFPTEQDRFNSLVRPSVLLISIDGLRWSYIKESILESPGNDFPNLRSIVKDSKAVSQPMLSVYPAVTFPAHTTMITGKHPRAHGVYQNQKFVGAKKNSLDGSIERSKRELYVFQSDVQVPTIFDLAARDSAINSSAIQWPVMALSESVDHLIPDIPMDTPLEKEFAFRTCVKGEIARKFIRSPEHLWRITDRERMELSLSIIRNASTSSSPQLHALHLIEFDHAQHVNGYKSEEALKYLKMEDEIIGTMMQELDKAGLLHTMDVFIVSDHGFNNFTHSLSPGVLLAKHNLIEGSGEIAQKLDGSLDWLVLPYSAPGISAIYINPELKDKKVRNELERQVSKVLFEELTKPPSGIIDAQKFPANNGVHRMYLGHDEVSKANLTGFPGAIAIIETVPGVVLSDRLDGALIERAKIPNYVATHGWNPSFEQMRATFIARGPSIRADNDIWTDNSRSKSSTNNIIEMIDLAPTIHKILGLNIMENDAGELFDGRILHEILN